MNSQVSSDDGPYRVVVNHEEQYSIWPLDRELALGWREAGQIGSASECLAYIGEVWTDMRPLSLRRFMDQMVAAEPEPALKEDEPEHLVRRPETEQRVEFASTLARAPAALRESIGRGILLIRFSETKGGTDLAVTLDRSACKARRRGFYEWPRKRGSGWRSDARWTSR